MTAFEKLNLVISEFPEHHPVRIAAVTAEYDISCLANMQQFDIQRIRKMYCTPLSGDQDQFNKLIKDVLLLDRMMFNRVEDIQILAQMYRGKEKS